MFGLRILAKAVEAWTCSGQKQRIGAGSVCAGPDCAIGLGR